MSDKPAPAPAPKHSFTNLIGGALIATGLVLVILQRIDSIDIGRIWPFFIIIPGAVMFGTSLYGKHGNKHLAAVGASITATGLLLLYQRTFMHFESWAYAWALVAPFASGAGWFIFGNRYDDPDLATNGKHQMLAGLAFFVIGLVFFELILGISGKALFGNMRESIIWPSLLIVGGFAMLIMRNRK